MAEPHVVAPKEEKLVIRIRQRNWLLWAIGLIALVYLVYVAREIWVPLSIAFLFAMVLDPVVDRMEHRGMSRMWATVVIFVSFFAVVAGTLFLTIPPLVRQTQFIVERVNTYMPDRSAPGIERFLVKNRVSPTIRPWVARVIEQTDAAINRSAKWFSLHAVEFASNLIWLVIIPIVSFYALKDFHLILAKFLLLVPRDKRDTVQTMVAEVTGIFARYMRGLALVSFLNGLFTWLLLMAFGVKGALMLGIVAGAIYGVPYLGAIITLLLTAGVTLVTGTVQQMVLVVAASFLLHQVVFDQIVTPKILGGHVGLHPILAIFALLIGNAVLGLVGMILAVPVAACVQIAVLSVVPKLRYEPEIKHAAETAGRAEATKADHVKTTATEELHTAVTEAVESIDQQAVEDGVVDPDDKK